MTPVSMTLILATSLASAPQQDLRAEAIAQRVHERVRVLAPSPTPVVRGVQVTLAGGRARVETSVKAVLRDGSDWIVDGHFVVHVDDEAGSSGRIENTTVGIGPTREEADESAADDWVSSIGYPLIMALDDHAPVRRAGAYRIYPGLPGSHTTVPPEWMDGSDPLHSRLLDALVPFLQREASGAWTTSSIFFVRLPGEIGSLDCVINGQRSEACSDGLVNFVWPAAPPRFMLKQSYVLVREGAHRGR